MECDREDDDPGRKVTWNYCFAFNGRPLPVKIFFLEREKHTEKENNFSPIFPTWSNDGPLCTVHLSVVR